MLRKLWLSALMFLLVFSVRAEDLSHVDTYQFETEAQQMQAIQLSRVLRCPTCLNQNLLESNAPISRDMRMQVYQMVSQGKSDQEIIGCMTQRFGDFVYYKPKLGAQTLVLWGLPVLMLLGFGLGIWRWSRRQERL